MALLPFGDEPDVIESYPWTPEERKFVSGVWEKFGKMYTLRAEPQDILGGISLQDYWDLSVQDYGVLADELRDPNDPVEQYQSTISRDKTDVFIANLIGQLLYSNVIAQNPEQDIDKVVSRVGSSLLEWAYKSDGWPSESGQQKNARYIHKAAVEGTSFVLDVVTKDGLESELIPNEELYFSTFWQPNLQKHPVIIRAKLNVLYEEAEQMFGDNENWPYVSRGAWTSNWVNEAPFLKDGFQGIDWADRCQILYIWKQATPKELKELKRLGKVKKSAKRACFYNAMVNDIMMFPPDNLLPYRHGFYNISRMKMFEFAKPEYLYGNSVPAKIREDKRWLDAWKTLLRYKGKLGVLKPSLVMGGTIEEEIMLPSKMTPVDEGVEIKTIEGVSDGVSQSDITLLQMAEGDIDRGTVSPQASGQASARKETARAAVIQASSSDKLLDAVSQQVAFFQASRSFPALLALFQLIPKRDIKKISIPDQTLSDGLRGSLEVIFQDPGQLDEAEELQKSFDIRAQETTSRKQKAPKDVVYINPKYLEDLKYYVTSDASSLLQDKNAMKIQQFQANMELFLANPDLIDRKEVMREFVRMNDIPDRILAKEGQGQQMPGQAPQPSQMGQPGGGGQLKTAEDAMVDANSKAQTGAGMPALAA